MSAEGLEKFPEQFRHQKRTHTHPAIVIGSYTNESQEGDPKPKSYGQSGATATPTDGASTGVGLYAIILLGGALAFAAYTYMNKQNTE